MNGWNPRLNGDGHIISGSGEVWLDDAMVGGGWLPDWVRETWVVYNGGTGTGTVLRNPFTVGPASPPLILPAYPYNAFAAGGNRWLGWWRGNPSTVRLHTADGTMLHEWVGAGLPAMNILGDYAFITEFGSDNPRVWASVDDHPPMVIYQGPVFSVSMCTMGVAVTVATGRYTRAVHFIRINRASLLTDLVDSTILDWEDAQAVDGPDLDPWILSTTQWGWILRPVGSSMGYAEYGMWFAPCARFIHNSQAWMIVASDVRGGRVTRLVSSQEPRTELLDDEPPSVNRPLWAGTFVFNNPAGPFGNVDLLVSDPMLVRSLSGRPLYQYVDAEAAGTLEALNAAIRAAQQRYPTLPVIPYWPRGFQGGPLPEGDTVGIELYRGLNESLKALEARGRAGVARSAHPWLIAQMYSSNAANHPDLQSVVRVYARIAREMPQVEGILAFSSGTRPSGWNDHPEVHDEWDTLMASIPGTPPLRVLTPTTPPDPPDPIPPTPIPPQERYPRMPKYVASSAAERGGLVGPAGLYLRRVPGSMGRGLFKGMQLLFDASAPENDALWEMTQPDTHFKIAAPDQPDLFLGFDATQHSNDMCRQAYTSGGEVTERGGYESLTVARSPSGLVLVFVDNFDRDDRRYAGGGPLTWVKA